MSHQSILVDNYLYNKQPPVYKREAFLFIVHQFQKNSRQGVKAVSLSFQLPGKLRHYPFSQRPILAERPVSNALLLMYNNIRGNILK